MTRAIAAPMAGSLPANPDQLAEDAAEQAAVEKIKTEHRAVEACGKSRDRSKRPASLAEATIGRRQPSGRYSAGLDDLPRPRSHLAYPKHKAGYPRWVVGLVCLYRCP